MIIMEGQREVTVEDKREVMVTQDINDLVDMALLTAKINLLCMVFMDQNNCPLKMPQN